VKNLVWDKIKDKYPNLVRVGEDPGENPNGTLIVSKKMDSALANKVKSALLALENDSSAAAKAARNGMKVRGYLDTSIDDFKHTIPLLKKAGVDKSFNFKY
jgi:ABC-type phosphate/phosphonate transport system substrate-binding protein